MKTFFFFTVTIVTGGIKWVKIGNHYISKYDSFVCIFDQLNAGLMSIGDFFQNIKK